MKRFMFALFFTAAHPGLAEDVKIKEGKKPMEAEGSKPENTPKVEAKSNVLQVGVKGMVCAFCAQGIEKQFKAQKEVEAIEVSLENSYVRITFKDGQSLSQETIAKLLKDAGYEASFGG
jgi:mercuric ion binding protein